MNCVMLIKMKQVMTISKSGLHHRFKKLSEQAAQLMQMQNE